VSTVTLDSWVATAGAKRAWNQGREKTQNGLGLSYPIAGGARNWRMGIITRSAGTMLSPWGRSKDGGATGDWSGVICSVRDSAVTRNLRTSQPSDVVMRPVFERCQALELGRRQGRRVAAEKTTNPGRSSRMLADRSCFDRNRIRVMLSRSNLEGFLRTCIRNNGTEFFNRQDLSALYPVFQLPTLRSLPRIQGQHCD